MHLRMEHDVSEQTSSRIDCLWQHDLMPIRFQKDQTSEAYGREKLTAEEAKNLVAQIAARQQSRHFNGDQVARRCLDGYNRGFYFPWL